ncbi:Aldo keto reductase [Micractinium conductrix]|uniref:Aldo keto reductase n=1 Tax=Micractinium conductrix TaxID=554055 RepID=A0A2P6VMD5_9CHLO|nr:Aldo keto reductase [Micractinium conductrix]|eukprot:PSC75258.1 Aldo keto reductase [Micractinium conductrix]
MSGEAPPQQPGFLQRTLHRVEDAWFASAEKTRCWSFDVKDEGGGEESVRRMNAVRLATGALLPSPGLGVYRSAAGGECLAAVASALRLGYRHIDTAQLYGNEGDVGRAVAESGLRREEVFITTKIWTSNWGYDACRASLRQSLAELGTPYADLVLLHAPGDPATRADTWRALEDAAKEGQARAIGVSNFGIAHLQKLAQTATIKPAVNQIELHPWLQRRELVDFCRQQGMAYSPLAKAQKLSDLTIAGIAQRMGVTPAQVLIRWSMQKGFVPLPKSNHPERQQTNLDVFRFELCSDDVAALDRLEEGLVTGWDPIAMHDV